MEESPEKPSPASGIASGNESAAESAQDSAAATVSLEKALALAGATGFEHVPQNQGIHAVLSSSQARRRVEGLTAHSPFSKIPVNVQVILGATRMPLSRVMSLGPGSIVALDKELSEPVVLLVNGNEVARGLIVVVDETTGQLGVSLTEILSSGAGESAARPV
jgi:flagellar motor switch protein FliN